MELDPDSARHPWPATFTKRDVTSRVRMSIAGACARGILTPIRPHPARRLARRNCWASIPVTRPEAGPPTPTSCSYRTGCPFGTSKGQGVWLARPISADMSG